MASDEKILHAANVLVCGSGLLAADTFTGGAASMIGGMLSWREVNKKRSDEMVGLQTQVAGRLRELVDGTDPDDPRHHLADMINFAAPTPTDVMIAGRDAAALTEHLLRRAHEAAPKEGYDTHPYQSAFRREVGQMLERLLDEPGFADLLAPAFQTAVLDAFAHVKVQLDRIIADVGSLAEALSQLERLPRDQMETLALRFDIEGIYDLGDPALRDALEERARDYRALKEHIEHLDDGIVEIARLKAKAHEAAAALDFEKVETLLAKADAVETKSLVATKLTRARNALLRDNAHQASRLFASAAGALGSVSGTEANDLWLSGTRALLSHFSRYGGQSGDVALGFANTALAAASQSSESARHRGFLRMAAGVASYQLGRSLYDARGSALLSAAITHSQAALDDLSATESPDEYAGTLGNAALAHLHLGMRLCCRVQVFHLEHAVALSEQSCDLLQSLGNQPRLAEGWANLGFALSTLAVILDGPEQIAMFERAERVYRDALQEFQVSKPEIDIARLKEGVAISKKEFGSRTQGAAGVGRLKEAVNMHEAASSIFRRLGYPRDQALAEENLGWANLALGRHPECDDPCIALETAEAHVSRAQDQLGREAVSRRTLELDRLKEAIRTAKQGHKCQ